ncbi:MAG: hypothetical protein HXS46_18585 [Theionarchaea archaeon]|nr:hypothetical protein [Theionarchaea archaeon]
MKQAGFSWLVYPSATHTRYAHSLGCWYLAEQALECVKVREPSGTKKNERFLRRWLEDRDLVEEFLLSLLLNDVGHFPFSYVLQMNPRYYSVRPEDVGVQLIRGEGEFFRIFRDITLGDSDIKYPRNVEFLSDALKKFKFVDVDVVSALISQDLSYLKNAKQEVKEAIPVLMELVSGLIDLDKIDHYHRDSHFMGLKITSISPVALLANMVIVPESFTEPPSARTELEDDGIMQIFSLLESRETLKDYVFGNEYNEAYSAMLNRAVDIFLEENPGPKKEVLLWTDHYLLNRLASSGNVEVVKLVKRIINGSPYVRVGKYFTTVPRKRTLEWVKKLREHLISYLQVEAGLDAVDTDLLITLSKGFLHKRKLSPDDWFRFDRIYDANGELVSTINKYSRRVEYFKGTFDKETPYLKIFASNFAMKNLIERKIRAEDFFSGEKFLEF